MPVEPNIALRELAEQLNSVEAHLTPLPWVRPAVVLSLLDTIATLTARNAELEKACYAQQEEICQELGKALGYPWFKDDQATFPGATEVNGVCVGDHVAESLAAEAARRIATLTARVAEAEKAWESAVDRANEHSRFGDDQARRVATAEAQVAEQQIRADQQAEWAIREAEKAFALEAQVAELLKEVRRWDREYLSDAEVGGIIRYHPTFQAALKEQSK